MISATSRSTFLAVAGAHRFILASSFLAIAVIVTLSYFIKFTSVNALRIAPSVLRTWNDAVVGGYFVG
jgi:hypothetical protein